MRRSLPTLLLSLLLLVVLVACGDDGDDRPMGSMPGGDMDAGGHVHDESSPVADGARRIEVAATSFRFGPDEIVVAAGDDVAIALSSDDVLHDFAIDGVDVHVSADRGETEVGGLRVDDPGEYTFYCTVPGHREAGMEGTLVVEPT